MRRRIRRTTFHENKALRPRSRVAMAGQSVAQPPPIGDRMEVDLAVVAVTPFNRLTRAAYRYHILSNPDTGRTHGSV